MTPVTITYKKLKNGDSAISIDEYNITITESPNEDSEYFSYSDSIMYDAEAGLYYRDGRYVYPKPTVPVTAPALATNLAALFNTG